MPAASLFPASPSYKFYLKFLPVCYVPCQKFPSSCLQLSSGCKPFCQKFLCSPGCFRSLALQSFFFPCVSLHKGCVCEDPFRYVEARELHSRISVASLCVHSGGRTQIFSLGQQVLELPRPFSKFQFEINFNESKINKKS